MLKSDIQSMPGYFDRYINQVQEPSLFAALAQSKRDIEQLDMDALHKLGDQVYAPGKWTIKDVFQHLLDCERVMAYRALRFARKDTTLLPGFDEELYGQTAYATNRTLQSIVAEMLALRTATQMLFESFDASVFHESGICFNQQVSVLALGFIIVGHQIHHLKIIEERYMPLIGG
jgi:hypothetical protein